MVHEIPKKNLFKYLSYKAKDIGYKTIGAYLLIIILVGAISLTFYLGQQEQTLVQQASYDSSTSTFLETFDGQPSTPQPFTSTDWDIVTNISDSWASGENWPNFTTTHAHHGTDCAPPLATHAITNIYNTVFNCKDHMMTSIEGRGYSVVYLTPNHKVNFENGEAVIKMDVSSFKSSGRQWWDIWVQPYENNFQLPLEDWLPAYSGEPKNAISIKMEGDTFEGFVVNNFNAQGISKTADGWKSLPLVLQENNLPVSPTRRDTYELRISKTHVKFGLPALNHWWIDADISNLGWGNGIVTLGTHEYNSSKDCTPNPPTDCAATTWHWDNVSITPATPFTIIRGNERGINSTTSNVINFPKPAPANSHLRFAAIGTIQLSFDNGSTYQNAQKNVEEKNAPEHFSNYWTPIPQGTTAVLVKGSGESYIGQWLLRDPAIFSETSTAGDTQPIATSTTIPTITTAIIPTTATAPTPTTIPSPTPTRTPTPTFAPSPTPTPTNVPTIPNSVTIKFDDISIGNQALNGVYPANGINWGSGSWYVSDPWKLMFTKSLSFNGGSLKNASFSFIEPRILHHFDAYTETATTVTVSCSGLTTRQFTMAAGSYQRLVTNWTSPCTTVTITSTNGWDTNFDNFVIGTSNATALPTATPTIVPTTNPLAGEGLTGNYYNDMYFNDFAFTRADKQVNFNFRKSSPHTSIQNDTYSISWKGQVLAPTTGTYTFYTRSDDGVRLWVNGTQLVNNWTNHAATENKGTIALEAGKKYDIKLDYFENTGESLIQLRWSGPGISKQIIPQKNLFLQ